MKKTEGQSWWLTMQVSKIKNFIKDLKIFSKKIFQKKRKYVYHCSIALTQFLWPDTVTLYVTHYLRCFHKNKR